MKKTIFLLSTVFLCAGCDNHSKRYSLNTHQGSGWNYSSASIVCDSFKMISTKECIFWNGGVAGNIKSENVILPNNVRGF